MAGNASKIGIISSALVLIGDSPINSLDDAGAGATVAATLYDSALNNLFSIYRWRFAIKKTKLNRLVEKPLNNFTYKFTLPADFSYLVQSSSGRDFELYQNELYSNSKDIDIDYGYVADESDMPPWFVSTLELYLASIFAIPITGNATKASFYNGLYEQQFKKARHTDSAERPNIGIVHKPFTQVIAGTRY